MPPGTLIPGMRARPGGHRVRLGSCGLTLGGAAMGALDRLVRVTTDQSCPSRAASQADVEMTPATPRSGAAPARGDPTAVPVDGHLPEPASLPASLGPSGPADASPAPSAVSTPSDIRRWAWPAASPRRGAAAAAGPSGNATSAAADSPPPAPGMDDGPGPIDLMDDGGLAAVQAHPQTCSDPPVAMQAAPSAEPRSEAGRQGRQDSIGPAAGNGSDQLAASGRAPPARQQAPDASADVPMGEPPPNADSRPPNRRTSLRRRRLPAGQRSGCCCWHRWVAETDALRWCSTRLMGVTS